MSVSLPGFTAPVEAGQACFRAVLAALSAPGSLHEAGQELTPPAPVGAAMAAVLLTLVDGDTTLALAGSFGSARDWLVFHTGAEVVADAGEASFVAAPALPDLARLRAGSDEAPEDGATVLVEVASLTEGPPLILAGPGLAAPARFCPALPSGFAAIWAQNHALFPRGVDLILCAGGRLAALPRSVRITEGAG